VIHAAGRVERSLLLLVFLLGGGGAVVVALAARVWWWWWTRVVSGLFPRFRRLKWRAVRDQPLLDAA